MKMINIFNPENNGWTLEDSKYDFHWFDGDQLPGFLSHLHLDCNNKICINVHAWFVLVSVASKDQLHKDVQIRYIRYDCKFPTFRMLENNHGHGRDLLF
ncbi:unnamed protein product, partial [Brenthis ino]